MDRQSKHRRADASVPPAPDEHPVGDHPRFVASTGRAIRWPVACWVFILAAIGVVQIVRLQWFDAAVFLVAVVGVVAAARTRAPGRGDTRSDVDAHGVHAHGVDAGGGAARIALPFLAGAVAILGAILCFIPRHGLAMQLVVIIAGFAAAALAWTGAGIAHPDRTTDAGIGIRYLAWSWAAILVAGCLWELAQFILGLVQPDAAWFSLSDLLNPAVATVPGRIVFIALWLAGGVWLLRRGGAR